MALVQGEENVKRVLKEFGLTETQAEVYLVLSKRGVLKGTEIARQIKKDKAQVYHILKSLQAKGLVESTLEAPVRFAPVPFEKVVDSSINAKREEAARIENAKEELFDYWKNISKTKPKLPLEKFVVIEGSHKIYSKILQMVKETKNQLSAMSSIKSLARADQFGILDAASKYSLKPKGQFRFLTELSEQNSQAMRAFFNRMSKAGINLKGRTPDLGLKLYPRMIIRDEEEVVFFIKSSTEMPTEEQNDTCLWTNCKSLVQAFSALFEDSWDKATDIQKRIEEAETGRQAAKTGVTPDATTPYKKYDETMQVAKQEVFMMTSAEGLNDLVQRAMLLKEWARRGVSVKIMAPITSGNLKAAQLLSECCEVKHVPTSSLKSTVVDGRHLFQFKNPPTRREEIEALSFCDDTFYTNDMERVEKTKDMLNDLWKNAQAPSAVLLESVINPPKPKANSSESTIPRTIKAVIGPILLEDEKLKAKITEREILNKIINAQTDPAPVPSKGIVRQYGSIGQAIIHPPASFNLPDMLIHILHFEKHSTLGAEDAVLVCLGRETPKGHLFAPAAFVHDNPKASSFWKEVFAGIPLAQNIQLVKKDELQIRVHGNTLFCGWTMEIPLLPPPLSLQPSCILLEGYSNLKTGSFTVAHPSGYKTTHEYNGFEAFVTFLHPASKYSGPGTDGFMGRDDVSTTYPP